MARIHPDRREEGGPYLGEEQTGRVHEQGTRAPYPGEVVGNKEPPYEVVGTDALSPLLAQVDFPATREEVADRIGQARIAIDQRRTKSVAEVLDEVQLPRFESAQDLLRSVQRAWDQVAERQGRGGRQQKEDNLSGRPPRTGGRAE